MTDQEQLTKLTVNLGPQAHGALLEAAKATDASQTDVVSMALKLYAFLTKYMADGWEPALHRCGVVRPVGIADVPDRADRVRRA